MKKVLLWLMVGVFILSMTLTGISCTKETTAAETTAAETTAAETTVAETTVAETTAAETQKQLTFALVMPDLTDLWWIDIQTGVSKACESRGIKLLINDAKSEISNQVNAIENYISQDVDALLIAAVEPNAINIVAKKAMDAGITVVTISNPLDYSDTHITVDEVEMGTSCGEMAAEWTKQVHADNPVEFAVLDFPRLPSCIIRADTMSAVLTEQAPNTKVVARQEAYTVALGMTAGEVILQANPNVKVVIGINDGGCLGFAKAFYAANKGGDDVGIFAVGTAAEYMDDMANNQDTVLRGTLDLGVFNIAELAVESAVKLVEGEEVPKVINTPLFKVWQKDAKAWIEENK